jgi:hypothetical protein
MNNKNIIAVVNLLRHLDLRSLRNPEVVINLIRAFGISKWEKPYCGEDYIFINERIDQAGLYQTPAQLAEALIILSYDSINTYCEIGVFQGGGLLFISEYLRRFNPNLTSVGIDTRPDWLSPETQVYFVESEACRDSSRYTYLVGESDLVKGKTFDLCFIDGDHSLAGLQKDWANVGQYANVCMFHDIQEPAVPDVGLFWDWIKKHRGYDFIECVQYTSPQPTQGIGILFNDARLQNSK